MSEEVRKVHSREEAQRLAEELGEVINYEIIPEHPQQTPSSSTQRRIRIHAKKWIGKVADNIEATIRLNDALLVDPKVNCRCGAGVDVSEVADYECGNILGIALIRMEEYFQWIKKWNPLHVKASTNKILLDKFFAEQIKLWAQYQKHTEDWGAQDVSYTATAICPKCDINLGEIRVTLRLINVPEIMDVTKNQLINLEVSNEMMAYVSKQMRFRSIEELKEWLADKDAEQAKAILQRTITELNALSLPYEISRTTGTLTSLIGEVDAAMRARKIEFVNAIEKIVEERVHVIT